MSMEIGDWLDTAILSLLLGLIAWLIGAVGFPYFGMNPRDGFEWGNLMLVVVSVCTFLYRLHKKGMLPAEGLDGTM